MRVFLQIVDIKSGIYQCGMIDEPVKNGLEIQNAIGHFGINYGSVKWENKSDLNMFGIIEGTSKVISIITPENIASKSII